MISVDANYNITMTRGDTFARTLTLTKNGQSVHLSNVSLTKNQVVSIRARARNTSNYMYVSNLTIVQN